MNLQVNFHLIILFVKHLYKFTQLNCRPALSEFIFFPFEMDRLSVDGYCLRAEGSVLHGTLEDHGTAPDQDPGGKAVH